MLGRNLVYIAMSIALNVLQKVIQIALRKNNFVLCNI